MNSLEFVEDTPTDLLNFVSKCESYDALVEQVRNDRSHLLPIIKNLKLTENSEPLAARLLYMVTPDDLSNVEMRQIVSSVETTLRNHNQLNFEIDSNITIILSPTVSTDAHKSIAHKSILTLESPYFEAAMRSYKESIENVIDVSSQKISPKVYQKVIEYIYCSDEKRKDFLSTVNIKLLPEILQLAFHLQLKELCDQCDNNLCNYLEVFSKDEKDINDWLTLAGDYGAPKLLAFFEFLKRSVSNKNIKAILDQMDSPDNPETRKNIALSFAKQDGEGTARHIKNFGITDQNALIDICLACSKQNGRGTAVYIKKFGITDQNALIEIYLACTNQSGWGTAVYITNFGITDQDAIINKIIRPILRREVESKNQVAFEQFLSDKKHQSNLSALNQLYSDMKNRNPRMDIRLMLSQWFAYASGILCDMTPGQADIINKSGLLEDIYNHRNPLDRYMFIRQLCYAVEQNPDDFKNINSLVEKELLRPWAKLSWILLSRLKFFGIKQEQAINIFNLINNRNTFKKTERSHNFVLLLLEITKQEPFNEIERELIAKTLIRILKKNTILEISKDLGNLTISLVKGRKQFFTFLEE